MAILNYDNIFELKTKMTSYIIGINEAGGIQNLHWGKQVNPEDCISLLNPRHHSSFDQNVEKEREEYNPWGGLFYGEPSLKAMYADNVRDLKLACSEYSIDRHGNSDQLTITLKDLYYGLQVDLIYRTQDEFDLVERYCRIINNGETPIMLENACSAVWNIPEAEEYRLTHVTGKWACETQLRSCDITEGKKILECRKGSTGSSANPWFAIDNGFANEEAGDVWFGALAWSGNWKITVEKTAFNNVRVVGGINDFDFAWNLKAGETFETPVFVGGYSDGGFGGMSRKLHKYQMACVMPKTHADEIRKVLYNSWEATGFDVNAAEQVLLAQKAAKLGVELFVVDDGWFGSRNSDMAGLGDWYVNTNKFPGGLDPLIKEVNELGMDFGIWVEPEMVNPDSDLYRAHPDWVYSFTNREGSLARNQLVLNLSKNEVKNYILGFMTDLLSQHNIKFIKWDMNRPISEPGWMEAPLECQREIWVRHVQNLYAIWEELRRKFPHVVFESCSGGGGRVDLGILRYADEFWTSDNTDALDRQRIQEGFSYVYCPKAMMCWVTDSPNWLNGRKVSVKYRFVSAMMGSLGIGGNLNEWSEEELNEAEEMVSLYKGIRHTVQDGTLYRLSSPRKGNTVVQYVDNNIQESVVLALGHSQQFGDAPGRTRLRGLDPEKIYSVRIDDEETFSMSGKGLMNIGLFIQLRSDFDSRIIRIK
ncbi:MAG TPA: alpha-galactosidase [Ruminiclostridium sp.]|nr:alpha-galactosidase [Ruminiclostridium sp.]